MFDSKMFSAVRRFFPSEKEQMESKWELIQIELSKREEAAKVLMDALSESKYEETQTRLIAETVMTIENAQTYLTQKADSFYRLGFLTAFFAASLMLIMGLHLLLDISISPKWTPSFLVTDPNGKPDFTLTTITKMKLPSGEMISLPVSKLKELNTTEITITETSPTYEFIAYTMKRLAGGGFIAGLIIFLISLARSFFHESTAFKNERHNIRLGKLIPYAIKPEDMNYKEFLEVTQWGKESNSAFKDISPESSGKTILTYSVEALKAMSEAVKNTKNQDKTSQSQGT